MPGDARFAKGNRAGGVVEQQRRLTFSREDNAQRIGCQSGCLCREAGASIGSPTTLTKWIEIKPAAHCSAQ